MLKLSTTPTKCPFSSTLSTSAGGTKLSSERPSDNLAGDREFEFKATGNGIPKSSFLGAEALRPPPLTAKEIYRLKTTWNTSFESYVNVKEAGVDTIISLFKRTPELLHFFEWILKEVPEGSLEGPNNEKLRTNLVLQRHATKVIRTIDLMIGCIDNPKKMGSIAESAACKHLRNRNLGFTSDKFQAIVGPLVDTMRRILGSRFNAELESVYTHAFSYVVAEVSHAFDVKPNAQLRRASSEGQLFTSVNLTESRSSRTAYAD